ncbi:hypothetical protein N7453_002535 [Penicillium expansum]|nr:hypothetical protein N7453_002535 [Penicillium expansum]
MAGVLLYTGGTEIDTGAHFAYKASPGDSAVARIAGDLPNIFFGGSISRQMELEQIARFVELAKKQKVAA